MAETSGARAAGVALLAAVLLTLTACGGTSEAGAPVVSGYSEDGDDGMHGAVLDEPYTWAGGTLTDTAGDEVDLDEQLDAPLTLVFFGYTHCPDICQAVMANIASAVARLDDAQAAEVDTWFVTTDPARDDPATLRDYLDRFNPDFEGFTGPLDEIVAAAGSVHVALEKGPKLPSGGYEITHGTPILAVTPDGSVPILWTEGTSAAQLAEDLEVLLTGGVPTTGEDQTS